jgi:hypothetical protein
VVPALLLLSTKLTFPRLLSSHMASKHSIPIGSLNTCSISTLLPSLRRHNVNEAN